MEFKEEQKPSEENVQAKLNTEDVELNEDQLEAAAGGVFAPGGCFPSPIIIKGPISDVPAPNFPIDPSTY